MSGRPLIGSKQRGRAEGRTPFSSSCDRRQAVRGQPLSMGTRDRQTTAVVEVDRLVRRRAVSFCSFRSRPRTSSRTYVRRGTPWSHGRPLYHFRYRPARLGSPFSSVVELDSLCALHNPFCNSTLRTGAPVSFIEIDAESLESLSLFFCIFSNLPRYAFSVCSDGRRDSGWLRRRRKKPRERNLEKLFRVISSRDFFHR